MNQSDKTLKADRSLHSGDGDSLTKIHHEHLWEPEILDSLLGLSPLLSQHMISIFVLKNHIDGFFYTI